jgi:SAM-dependent methyltransferase
LVPDYYTSEYRDYERQNPTRKLDHYLDAIDRLAERPVDLLDIGCGRGAFLERVGFRHPNWNLHGTDLNANGLEATRVRVPNANLTLSSADLRSHPHGSLGVITAWDVVEHVGSLEDVASAVKDMLQFDGVFAFVVPVYDGPLGRAVEWLDKDPTHVHKEGRDFWLDWAGGHFEILEWHGIFRLLVGGYYIHIPTRRLRRQATAILVVCRRSFQS